MILTISEGVFLLQKQLMENYELKIRHLGSTSQNIKPMSNRNNITCGCKACTSSISIQSDINKWRLLH